MKKALKKSTIRELFFYHNGIKKIIDPQDKSSYPPNLYGNISSNLYGNISNLYGNCTNIEGDIDDCKLANKEREKGVNIEDLISLKK